MYTPFKLFDKAPDSLVGFLQLCPARAYFTFSSTFVQNALCLAYLYFYLICMQLAKIQIALTLDTADLQCAYVWTKCSLSVA